MLRRMSEKADAIQHAKNTQHFGSAIRAEFPLLVGLGTIAIFLVVGSDLSELTTRTLPLLGIFVWLFAVILWSAMCVVRHADCLAIKFGEPYGTLILTLSAIAVEVTMISMAMLHGANNPTLARDAMFVAVAGWIALPRAILQSPGRQFLSQRHHGAGGAWISLAEFYDFYERTHIFHGAGN